MEFTGWHVAIALAVGLALGLMLRGRAPRGDLSAPPRDLGTGAGSGAPARLLPGSAGESLPPLNPEQAEAIHAALLAGNKIEAIKLLREATGLGLKESKDAVERLETGPSA